MRKRVLLLLLAFLLMGFGCPAAINADTELEIVQRSGDGIWTGSTWLVNVYPEESKTADIRLFNSSWDKVHVRVLLNPSSLNSGSVTLSTSKTSFYLLGRNYTTVRVTAAASGDACPDTYQARIVFSVESSYCRDDDNDDDDDDDRSSSGKCEEPDEPRVPFSQFPDTSGVPPLKVDIGGGGDGGSDGEAGSTEEEEEEEEVPALPLPTGYEWPWYAFVILGLLGIIAGIAGLWIWARRRYNWKRYWTE